MVPRFPAAPVIRMVGRLALIGVDASGTPRSRDLRPAHHRFRFLADLAGDLVRIALLELRQEELDRERTGVFLLRELAKHPGDRRDAVAGNDARRVVQELA